MSKKGLSPINLHSPILAAVMLLLTSTLAMLVIAITTSGQLSFTNSGQAAGKRGVCPDVYAPMCAKNGMTYSNACQAAKARQQVQCPGNCPCDRNTAPVPPENPSAEIVCPQVYQPVCGQDGQTHGNDCVAARAGTTIACQGECPCPVGE